MLLSVGTYGSFQCRLLLGRERITGKNGGDYGITLTSGHFKLTIRQKKWKVVDEELPVITLTT